MLAAIDWNNSSREQCQDQAGKASTTAVYSKRRKTSSSAAPTITARPTLWRYWCDDFVRCTRTRSLCLTLPVLHCPLMWQRSPNPARLNWRDVIGPGLLDDWLRNGWCMNTYNITCILLNRCKNELFICAALFRSRMIAFVLFIVCFWEPLSDAVCDTGRCYQSSSRS